jgi:hypothetical protein
VLEEKLKPAICNRHRGLLSKAESVLLYDNVQPYIAAATVTTMQKLKFETINHPPYSPDLAPSDYHVFGMLKKALRGRRFHSNDEVKKTVHFWLRQEAKTFFLLGYRSLSNDVKSALQRTVTMWKNNTLFGSVYMMCISI